MHKSTISSRREIITAILLLFAVGGGLLRWLAPQPSLARDMGSLLLVLVLVLVLWVPIIGNIIAWVVAQAHKPKNAPPGFAPDSPFTPSAHITLTLLAAEVPSQSRPIRAGLFNCMVVVGHEAFSARLQVPPHAEPVPEVAQPLEVEFLRPEVALPKLKPGTDFTLLSGRTLLGRGQVQQ